MSDMTGKVVLITGASRGIGAETARLFAAAGAKVGLIARSKDKVADLAGEIGADNALAIPCDVSRYWEVEAAVKALHREFGGLDVLIGNAGLLQPIAHLSEAEPEAWGETVDVNLKGVFHGMRAVLPGMIAQGSGTIITVSSGAAHGPVEAWSSYCASKAGAYMLTRMADLEARAHGVRVLGLSPGTVATEMQRQIKASGINPVSQLDWSDHIPPDWPAKALLWMCGAEADAWLGQDISLREPEVRAKVGLSG
jgi:NAD(P)-dependent dehydrogenase (short-subunit alcohol dehydrogenase family)